MSLVLAIPRGRVASDIDPLLRLAGIVPEPAFYDPEGRKLRFATSVPDVSIVRVRSFDVASIVALGGADLGIAGSDIRLEYGVAPIRSVLNLQTGFCRLSVATLAADGRPLSPGRRIMVATKYTNIARAYFASRGLDAVCVKLHGAVELAPQLGLSEYIVDLVSTGATLAAHGLKEIETICSVSSELIVKTGASEAGRSARNFWIRRFEYAVAAMRLPASPTDARQACRLVTRPDRPTSIWRCAPDLVCPDNRRHPRLAGSGGYRPVGAERCLLAPGRRAIY
jgi:ATP phosphoribosyltransferase